MKVAGSSVLTFGGWGCVLYDKPISYSGMKLFKRCPYAWMLAYIQGQRSPKGPAAERGDYLHKRLEEFFLGQTPYPKTEKALRPWQRYMENLAAQGLAPEAEVGVRNDWTKTLFDDPKAYARGKLDGRLVQARKLKIYDWKSGKIYDEHKDQGEMYIALEGVDGYEYETNFVYLDQYPVVHSRAYAVNAHIPIRDALKETIDTIRTTTEFLPTPSNDSCRWCDHSWRRGGHCTKAP